MCIRPAVLLTPRLRIAPTFFGDNLVAFRCGVVFAAVKGSVFFFSCILLVAFMAVAERKLVC